jgi:ABC-type lipoprotein export system ATPase subunit
VIWTCGGLDFVVTWASGVGLSTLLILVGQLQGPASSSMAFEVQKERGRGEEGSPALSTLHC